MAKAFFATIFFFGLGGITVLLLAQIGVLPPSVYSFFYAIELHSPLFNSSVPPYLQKFEGAWNITFTPSQETSSVGDCAVDDAVLQIHKGIVSGTLMAHVGKLPFTAHVTEDGAFSGTFGGNSATRQGTLQGTLANGDGVVSWSDTFDCSGTAALHKQDPVTDPVKGRAFSVTGDASLVRDNAPRELVQNMDLYAGDEVQVGSGTVLLGIGFDLGAPITLPSGATYTVK